MALAGIIETLDKQYELYGQLLESAKEKTPVLVGNDIERLNAITLRERKLIAESERLETLRIRYTQQYFASLGFRSTLNRLSEVVQSVSQSEDKKRLLDRQSALSAMLQEIKRVNDLNQQLIAQSLAFINYSIDLLVDDPLEDMTYQHPQNRLSGSGRAGLFDTKA